MGQPLRINRIDVERELCRRSLADFVRMAWHVVEPQQRYVSGWAVDAIAQHLEAVTAGDIRRLLINVPPGLMKSLLTGVFWPAWEWGPRGIPSMRYVCGSHEQGLAIRDGVKMRRLIQSDWYQARWPLSLTDDQNQKILFENSATGFRQASAIRSMTGRRGDRVVIDDPHSVEGATSDAERETACREFSETVPTRLNNPAESAIVVIMQRLHERDVSGLILSEIGCYDHLMLPMRFEPDRRCTTSIGFTDPRTDDGELLFPERFPESAVADLERSLREYGAAGQLQQRPAPRGGGLIKADRLEIGEPTEIKRAVRYWDKAGTHGGGAYTAGVLVGVDGDGRYWILDVVRGQWAAPERERMIKLTADTDGRGHAVWIEQEPGSGGKESAEATVRNLAGWNIRADRVTGDKGSRAGPLAVQIEAGNVRLKRAAWNRPFIDECVTFPAGKYKDQVDAAAGAFAKLTSTEGPISLGLRRAY